MSKDLSVIGNPELLETAVENLLENALDFSPRGSQLLLSARRSGGDVVIAVGDEGPGVPGEDLERIFERYVSIRPEADPVKANFGIGLWIVRRNLEAMDGGVSAHNRPEGGLMVEMTLPAA